MNTGDVKVKRSPWSVVSEKGGLGKLFIIRWGLPERGMIISRRVLNSLSTVCFTTKK